MFVAWKKSFNLFVANSLKRVVTRIKNIAKGFVKYNGAVARWFGIVLGLVGLLGLFLSYRGLDNNLRQFVLSNSPHYNQPILLEARDRYLIVTNVSRAILYFPYSVEYWDVFNGSQIFHYNISDDGPMEVDVNSKMMYSVPDKFLGKDGLIKTKICYSFDSNPFKVKELDEETRHKLFFYFHTNYPVDWHERNDVVRQAYPEASCSVFILAIKNGGIEDVY
jgi:hypothetical protein